LLRGFDNHNAGDREVAEQRRRFHIPTSELLVPGKTSPLATVGLANFTALPRLSGAAGALARCS